ncbi:hypothetical protein M9H77_23900 [Catharanthus roseus]|uniref:Uncharacterized protein n=1 Tax=Catharanthus roseus TaxID=4058 RepID=A0ACC0AX42_CATRO|nr:hypothetical protein M9H77_23900 [Catharanthus roseus]
MVGPTVSGRTILLVMSGLGHKRPSDEPTRLHIGEWNPQSRPTTAHGPLEGHGATRKQSHLGLKNYHGDSGGRIVSREVIALIILTPLILSGLQRGRSYAGLRGLVYRPKTA